MMEKSIIQKKVQKIFAYIKKKQYFCTLFSAGRFGTHQIRQMKSRKFN